MEYDLTKIENYEEIAEQDKSGRFKNEATNNLLLAASHVGLETLEESNLAEWKRRLDIIIREAGADSYLPKSSDEYDLARYIGLKLTLRSDQVSSAKERFA